jgi:hypothetical protein
MTARRGRKVSKLGRDGKGQILATENQNIPSSKRNKEKTLLRSNPEQLCGSGHPVTRRGA